MNIINRKNAKSLSAKSNNILDVFRQTITKYGKVNEQISNLEEKAHAKIVALQAEKDLLITTRLENEKQIIKINNFLN